MTEFRFYCLDAENKIIRGETVRVKNLTDAIDAARNSCRQLGGNSDRIEVWQGRIRVYP